MFFNNKKSEEKEEKIIKEETSKEKFVISNYAMERYKKSQHYKNTDLTNEEIELLFCDKSIGYKKSETNFQRVFSKLIKNEKGYHWIVFPPKYQHKSELDDRFFNCIFYEGSFQGNALWFKDCEFDKIEGTTNSFISFKVEKDIYFYNVQSNIHFLLNKCLSIKISKSNLYDLEITKSEIKQIDKINLEKVRLKSIYINHYNIQKLSMTDLIVEPQGKFDLHSHIIEEIYIDNLDLSNIKSDISLYTKDIKNLTIYNSTLPTFFNFDIIAENCYIQTSTIEFDRDCFNIRNKNLDLNIHKSKLVFNTEHNFLEIKCKKLSLDNINIEKKLMLYNINEFTCLNSNIQNIDFSNKIDEIYIYNSIVKEEINLSFLKSKECFINKSILNISNFKFASINKLAIYKSSFKELDFDCSFINEARFVQVKGLDEENKEEELSDKHFVSKESLNYFKTITNEKE